MKKKLEKPGSSKLPVRSIIEIAGLGIIISIVFFQHNLIYDVFYLIRSANVYLVVLVFLMYWLILPLTPISYVLLIPKNYHISFKHTVLALLAAAGPGRIVPGGVGTISIATIYLKKSGLSIQKSVGVAITNNIIGVITNILVIISIIILKRESLLLIVENIDTSTILLSAYIIIALIVSILFLNRIEKIHHILTSTTKKWSEIIRNLLKSPPTMIALVLIALSITLTYTLMLTLSALSLGLHINLIDIFIALSFGVTIGGIIPTPGGIGGVEAGIIAVMILLGYDSVNATSTALLFRAATYWQPLIPGTLSYFYLRKTRKI